MTDRKRSLAMGIGVAIVVTVLVAALFDYLALGPGGLGAGIGGGIGGGLGVALANRQRA